MTTHLDALNTRLSHERAYLAAAKTAAERELRPLWIAQLEREIAREKQFLGIEDAETNAISDDGLLEELFGE